MLIKDLKTNIKRLTRKRFIIRVVFYASIEIKTKAYISFNKSLLVSFF